MGVCAIWGYGSLWREGDGCLLVLVLDCCAVVWVWVWVPGVWMDCLITWLVINEVHVSLAQGNLAGLYGVPFISSITMYCPRVPACLPACLSIKSLQGKTRQNRIEQDMIPKQYSAPIPDTPPIPNDPGSLPACYQSASPQTKAI